MRFQRSFRVLAVTFPGLAWYIFGFEIPVIMNEIYIFHHAISRSSFAFKHW